MLRLWFAFPHLNTLAIFWHNPFKLISFIIFTVWSYHIFYFFFISALPPSKSNKKDIQMEICDWQPIWVTVLWTMCKTRDDLWLRHIRYRTALMTPDRCRGEEWGAELRFQAGLTSDQWRGQWWGGTVRLLSITFICSYSALYSQIYKLLFTCTQSLLKVYHGFLWHAWDFLTKRFTSNK